MIGRAGEDDRSFFLLIHVKFTLHSPPKVLSWSCKASFTLGKGGLVVRNKLEAFRKERGITQEELAEALEVSRQTISSLEKGRYNPSLILAFKLARYFGKPIEEIFIYEEE